ncbi:MAG: 50S ribosomal protein L9 [Ignavibacteria bacterium GWB2_35_12]|nr:MAG: 50S ribosomal protein L9 [Ignavibacteria bacterium GWB2_35_12]OGU91442.1 MAG: 50S ribosomal protein L9 [Ignavibacteria bacterium RIFOXYA2_FULL_35_10]OGV22228.1 MAG: 50S ribosomal protein L9 [Ignavibacteria bacterium RIFOXYC2_FULL_35_21]
MKVILRKDVDNLGNMGEVVTVKSGYARNFLIPRDFAYMASPGAVKALEVEKKQFAKRRLKEKGDAEILSTALSELQVSIAMKVGEEGKLYGSVTNQMVADELNLRGYAIDKKHIIIDEPIRSLGVFSVKVKLFTDVVANLKVWVISEE